MALSPVSAWVPSAPSAATSKNETLDTPSTAASESVVNADTPSAATPETEFTPTPPAP